MSENPFAVSFHPDNISYSLKGHLACSSQKVWYSELVSVSCHSLVMPRLNKHIMSITFYVLRMHALPDELGRLLQLKACAGCFTVVQDFSGHAVIHGLEDLDHSVKDACTLRTASSCPSSSGRWGNVGLSLTSR